MINGNIDGIGYSNIENEFIKKAFEIMKKLNADTQLGRTDIEESDFYYTVMEVDVAPLNEIKHEMHKKYIDIHYLIKAHEAIGIANSKRLGVLVPYSEEKDCAFLKDGNLVSTVVMEPGDFCIIYPYEAHKPGGMFNDFGKIKKAVFKIKV